MRARNQKKTYDNKGFTVIELVVTMLIVSIVMLSVFVVYRNQQEHHLNQLDITYMQQNLRAAVVKMTRDIRSAGFEAMNSHVARIETANSTTLYFTCDENVDGDVNDANEHIAYTLNTSNSTIPRLLRITSSSEIADFNPAPTNTNTIADYIEHLDFLYLDSDGDPTNTPANVRTVVVSIVVRSPNAHRNYQNNNTYVPASNLSRYVPKAADRSGTEWKVNDSFRRRMQIKVIKGRNLGT